MIMKFSKVLQAVVICAGLIGFGGANASVTTFNNVSDTSSILYSTTHDGATLSATIDFTLTALTANSATFALSVSNDSSGPGTNRLVSFGITTVDPALTGASTTGGVWDASIDTVLPTFQTVDLCIWSSNGCPGGGINNGLGEGLSNSFFLTLTTAGDFTNGISFTSPYGAKFQDVGVTGESFEFAGCIVGTPGCGGGGQTEIPEPASIALVGLGLLGASFARRRRQVCAFNAFQQCIKPASAGFMHAGRCQIATYECPWVGDSATDLNRGSRLVACCVLRHGL